MGCRPKHCRRRFKRDRCHDRGRGCGNVNATINNELEFEGPLVAGSTSVTISIDGNFNVQANNSGSANALCNSDRNSITNDA